MTKKIKRKISPYFSFLIMLLAFIMSFNALDKSKIKISDKELVAFLLTQSNISESNNKTYNIIKNKVLNIYNEPIKYLSISKYKKGDKNIKPVIKKEPVKTNRSPLIYIYNSHQTEEYAASTFLEYSVKPTIMMANYILAEQFENENYHTLVEERSIKEILNQNQWKYSYSYKASRILLEDTKKNNSTLKYFIDVHRDSLTKDRTTIEINGKSYAKLLFLIGLENPNYEENLKFTEEINKKLNEKYPNLSKGIYKKGGAGVNGIYNQDFSQYAILLEIGGYQNTPTEVMNSTLAFAECFLEVIKSYEAS